MKTELFTVSKIFHETLFRIPDYQRGYSWEESHLKDFWMDIEQLSEGKSHYTGVLTLETVPEEVWRNWEEDAWIIQSRRYQPYYVVDGQQRLTTVSILLQCIFEKCDGTDLNFTPLDTVRRKYIFERRADSLARAYIFGYEKDNPSYDFLITNIFDEKLDRHSTNDLISADPQLEKDQPGSADPYTRGPYSVPTQFRIAALPFPAISNCRHHPRCSGTDLCTNFPPSGRLRIGTNQDKRSDNIYEELVYR